MDNPSSAPNITALEKAARDIPDDNPNKCHHLYIVGLTLMELFKESRRIEDADKAISIFEDVIQLAPEGHTEIPDYLNSLGVAFNTRFESVGEVSDLNKAISSQDRAVQLTPEGHPSKAARQGNLGTSLQTRFERLGFIADLNKAVLAKEQAVELTREDEDKAVYLISLGASLQTRFKRLRAVEDLDTAVLVQNKAINLVPEGHLNRALFCSNLGSTFHTRFEHFRDRRDLDNAILSHEKAVEMTPQSHLSKIGRLANLGNSIHTRFNHFGDLGDLNRAISIQQNAVQLIPERYAHKASCLNNLGLFLQTRFEHLGDVVDLKQAILAKEQAVQLIPEKHPAKPGILSNLGTSFQTRFQRFGDIADLNQAILVKKQAVELTAERNPALAGLLSNLGNSFHIRFQHLGDITDLGKAILAQEKAVQLTPQGHPGLAKYMATLGNSFQTRFEYLKDIKDLNKAISAKDKAVKLIPMKHSDKVASLSVLGTSLQTRFEHLGNIADLDNAIKTKEQAVRLASEGDPVRDNCLSNLGKSLSARFKHTGNVTDIDKAISLLEQAMKGSTAGDSVKATYFGNHGVHLQSKFDHFKDISDLNKAISSKEQAVNLTPDGIPAKAFRLGTLGYSYQARFESIGDMADLHQAIHCFSEAAQSTASPASHRFRDSRRWANIASTISPLSSLDAYSCAISLLPQIAWLGQSVNKRHQDLSDLGSRVCEAVNAAISAKKYNLALEWLEQGRSIVWNQLLQLRTPIDNLQEKAPVLADQLKRVSLQLDHMSTRDISVELPSTIEEITYQHHQLALEWDRLMDSIRAVPGFEDFLQPKKLLQLRNAARCGPVVLINIYRDHCDALVLKIDMEDVIHIQLDQVSHDQVEKWQQLLKNVTSDPHIWTRSTRHMICRDIHVSANQMLGSLLKGLWLKIVKPVLSSLGYSVSHDSTPPRIWWCATGPLAFLPIHAAGIYDREDHGHKITDFVTSSYTPTLTALLETTSTTMMKSPFQLLAVIQPSAPGAGSLPNTEAELAYIQQHAITFPLKVLEGKMATKEQVICGMKECSWVHLACHGVQNIVDPTSSALLLEDGGLKLSEIIKLTLPNADFAFLSACQTATGDHQLSEESVHLAAGMLLAGYQGVIATMWSIMDKDAPIVADIVYAQLFKDQQPDSTQAAHALHQAVQSLREKGTPLISWVPFIHIGM